MNKWKMKNGDEIDVKDMSTSHIKNSLAMLKRKGFVSPREFDIFMVGPFPNGEHAQDAWFAEFDQLLESPVSRFIDIFEEELEKRGE